MTLYRFHGRITVEREESLSHLLYERMSIMYKVELKFDTSKLAPETADQIFEQEDLSCAVKALGSRIYLDRGRKQDYGRFWAAIFQLKNSVGIAENLLECFWYNGTEKENLITDFIRN
jgi:hypothetical protein